MPTILRQSGFSVTIFLLDHLPAHVHIFRAGGVTIINLGATVDDVEIRETHNMSRRDIRRAVELVEENHARFWRRWKEIHN